MAKQKPNGSVLAVIVAAAVIFMLVSTASAGEIDGAWSGTISFSGAEIRVIFHILESDDGSLTATMDSPDQGAKGIPVGGVVFDGDSLIISVGVTSDGYYGRYDGNEICFDGEWRQSGMKVPLRLVRAGEIKPPARPQEPKRPFPYLEEEIEFENGPAGITLAGTVTIPEGRGPFPAAILISGSGAQDRDETILGHKPFLVLSDHLTRNRIAVLRYDDRGTGKSGGVHGEATTEDFAADAVAAFSYMRSREEIDGSMTGLIGHSEGGIIAVMVAAGSPETAFAVMLAGPGLKGSQILHDQNLALLEMFDAPPDLIQRRSEQLKGEYAIIATGSEDKETIEAIVEFSMGFHEKYSPQEIATYGMSEEEIRLRAKKLVTPWYRFFLKYDPATALRRTKCPVLAMIGEKDAQVDPKKNLPAIENALLEGGNKDFRIVEMQGLNHLFQTAESGNPMEYSKIEETMSPAALETVSGWILSLRTGGER